MLLSVGLVVLVLCSLFCVCLLCLVGWLVRMVCCLGGRFCWL